MKKLILIIQLILLSNLAFADIECLGETARDKTFVTVHIENSLVFGDNSRNQRGWVRISNETTRVESQYFLQPEDISQFFEGLRGPQKSIAIVGLEAYSNLNSPITINYYGKNHNDRYLTEVMRDSSRVKDAGNKMIVWRGAGFASDDQYYFEDVVCSVNLAP